MQKVPVTVVTGFLGSGKTTLIRHLLTNSQGLRIAVLVNEFGELGIDGDLLKACGGCPEDDIVELTNGCLCCTVQEEFLPTMQALLKRRDRIDHILVETSGLALPKPLVQAFRWPEIRNAATVDGVVAVVDGVAVARGGQFAVPLPESAHGTTADELEELFEDQLACADLVLLNKIDQLESEEHTAALTRLRGLLGDGVKVLSTQSSAVDLRVVLGLSQAVEEQIANRPSHHDSEEDHEHDEEITSVTLGTEAPQDLDSLLACLKQLVETHEIYRIKGFVHVEAKPMRLVVQGVGNRFDRYFDRPWQSGETRRTDLVFIGRQLDSDLLQESLGFGC